MEVHRRMPGLTMNNTSSPSASCLFPYTSRSCGAVGSTVLSAYWSSIMPRRSAARRRITTTNAPVPMSISPAMEPKIAPTRSGCSYHGDLGIGGSRGSGGAGGGGGVKHATAAHGSHAATTTDPTGAAAAVMLSPSVPACAAAYAQEPNAPPVIDTVWLVHRTHAPNAAAAPELCPPCCCTVHAPDDSGHPPYTSLAVSEQAPGALATTVQLRTSCGL
mmetsp:Transcript_21265/g.52516  ORF Transcript_21265/g.52516 Transcript_21265/m.52516 type:complete len:218 (+) Transcript_21265:376-1029(+)